VNACSAASILRELVRTGGSRRQLLAAVDTVASSGRRSPLAARTVSQSWLKDFSLSGAQWLVRGLAGIIHEDAGSRNRK